MFTGIIQATGTISVIEKIGGDKRFSILCNELDISELDTGQSIAVNGVCLSIIGFIEQGFRADVSTETLSCTTFGQLFPGARVNLEKSLQLSSPLDGHLVSGHVDGVGYVVSHLKEARSERFEIEVPKNLVRYICRKGSISIDGVSLTINEVRENHIYLNIIPHTMAETIFSDYKEGTTVNIEVDLIARYLESLTGNTA